MRAFIPRMAGRVGRVGRRMNRMPSRGAQRAVRMGMAEEAHTWGEGLQKGKDLKRAKKYKKSKARKRMEGINKRLMRLDEPTQWYDEANAPYGAI